MTGPIKGALGWFVVKVTHVTPGGETTFEATVRIDTPNEWQYYRHGGILHYVLRQLVAAAKREEEEEDDKG